MEVAKLNEVIVRQYVLPGDKIRLRVVGNPKTPIHVLRKLSKDTNRDVRIAIAANPLVEHSVLMNLAEDDDVGVRHGMAQDINTPISVLQKLASDENGWVRGEAYKTLDILTNFDVAS